MTRGTLSTQELAELVRGAGNGLAPQAGRAVGKALADIKAGCVAARIDSEESRWLAQLIEDSPELLAPGARRLFDGIELYAVDSDHPNAFARIAAGTPQILVFSGLRHLIHYFADFVTVLALLQSHRADATIDDGQGGAHPEAFLFSMACTVVLADFVTTNRIPATLHDLLGPQAQNNVRIGFRTALLFVLLHELGHLELGHLSDGPLSEVAHVGLLEPETLSLRQADELAADEFAIAQIAPAYRADLISSLMLLMGGFALLEAFYGGLSASHPLAINRLARLADLLELDAGTRAIVSSWIGDRVRSFRSLAADRVAGDGSIGDRIAATMSIDHAYAVIAEVKRRVRQGPGTLEAIPPPV